MTSHILKAAFLKNKSTRFFETRYTYRTPKW